MRGFVPDATCLTVKCGLQCFLSFLVLDLIVLSGCKDTLEIVLFSLKCGEGIRKGLVTESVRFLGLC